MLLTIKKLFSSEHSLAFGMKLFMKFLLKRESVLSFQDGLDPKVRLPIILELFIQDIACYSPVLGT